MLSCSHRSMALYEAEENYLEGAWFVGIRKGVAPLTQKYQQLLDKCTPHTTYRWYFVAFIALVSAETRHSRSDDLCLQVYVLRVWILQGFFVVSYGLGIYILNLLIPFISPQDEDSLLPTAKDDEHRPFMRKMPEIKFWCVISKSSSWDLPDIPLNRHECNAIACEITSVA